MAGLANFLLAPIYAKILGIEAYGLIGFYTALQSIFVALDVGISSAIIRNLSQLGAVNGKQKETANIVRSLEVAYWGFAIFFGILVILSAKFLSTYWLSAENSSEGRLEQCIVLMGIATAFQWPSMFYYGGLMGLQHQILGNSIYAGAVFFRHACALFAIIGVQGSDVLFFLSQVFANVVVAAMSYVILWQTVPRTTERPAFKFRILVGSWRYAASMAGLSMGLTVLTQSDKIILSKMLTIEYFGYYSLAWVFASAIFMVQGPITAMLFPHISRMITLGDKAGIESIYHFASQAMSTVLTPLVAVVVFFPKAALTLWTRSPQITDEVWIVLVILMGTVFVSGVTSIPLTVQRATGKVGMALSAIGFAIILCVPLTYLGASSFGMLGGAAGAVLAKIISDVLQAEVVHRELLPKVRREWLIRDLGKPLVLCLFATGLCRGLLGEQESEWMKGLSMLVAYVTAVGMSILAAPVIRKKLFNLANRLR